MSIINDALKKAARQKQISRNQAHQILTGIEKEGRQKSGIKRNVSLRRLFWITTAGVSLLLALLAVDFVRSPLPRSYDPQAIPQAKPQDGALEMREINVEPALGFLDYYLNGILYF